MASRYTQLDTIVKRVEFDVATVHLNGWFDVCIDEFFDFDQDFSYVATLWHGFEGFGFLLFLVGFISFEHDAFFLTDVIFDDFFEGSMMSVQL